MFKLLLIIAVLLLTLNIGIMHYTGTDPAFLLGVESLILTIFGVSFLGKQVGTYTTKAGKNIDVLNVVAVAVAVSGVIGPWVSNTAPDNIQSNIYFVISLLGLLFLFADWFFFKNKVISTSTHTSETTIIEMNTEKKIITTIKK